MYRIAICALSLLGANPAWASDHLDTRTVIKDPRADIGDLFAWVSQDGKRLNLVMTIVGHSFSPGLDYRFDIDSGAQFGRTTATSSITCRMPSATLIDCRGADDFAMGNPSQPKGIESRGGHFRLFAGLRNDPFYNNVRGSRDAYQEAAKAIAQGAAQDNAGCWQFSSGTSRAILDKWRHTDGGPATDFLAGWTPASLVISVDLAEVARGGPILAVWATVSGESGQVDRMGRPLTGNAMLSPLAQDSISDQLKEDYNASPTANAERFVPEIEKSLALYDGFDGICGNGWLARQAPKQRYDELARLLADDRLWVNSRSPYCEKFMAVEQAALGGDKSAEADCGGRTPLVDAVDVYRSLLAGGRTSGVDDGVNRDEKAHSASEFPFLAAP